MSLKIHSVVNGRLVNQEYVWLVTTGSLNLKGYAVVDRTFTASGQLSNEFRHIFVFPDKSIEKDDWIRLYTSAGQYYREKITNGPGYIHNFYWGSAHPVWNNNGGDIASLINYSLINAVPVPAVT
jgi:hypothetical protein